MRRNPEENLYICPTRRFYASWSPTKTFAEGEKIPKTTNDVWVKKGAQLGNASAVFYTAQVFPRELGFRENKPKSKDRQKMMEVWQFGRDKKRTRDGRGIVSWANRCMKTSMGDSP